MRRAKFMTIAIILSAIYVLTFSNTTYAHRMIINPGEPGMIQVIFDDGTPAQSADVILYDDEAQELERGEVDSDGYYQYDTNLTIARIEANDGVGHRVVWLYGTESNTPQPIFPQAMLVASGFLFAASFFNYRSTMRRRQQA